LFQGRTTWLKSDELPQNVALARSTATESSGLSGSLCRPVHLRAGPADIEKSGSHDLFAVCQKTLITVHPSSVLRAPDPQSQKKAFTDFVADLVRVAECLNRR
jgi:hypothetical protein